LIKENKFCHSVIDVIFASRYLFIFYMYIYLYLRRREKKGKEKNRERKDFATE